MKDNILVDKTKGFAKEIIKVARNVRVKHKEYSLADQLLRAGTSIGANVHEANYAQSRVDFISKLEIALKECYETEYWLELLTETGCIDVQEYKVLKHDCGEIRILLIKSCKTAKTNA